MEFPDLVLDLIHQFSRPRIGKEAREVYKNFVTRLGPCPAVLRKMVTPHAVALVDGYNRESEVIEELLVVYRETPWRSIRSAQLRGALNEQYDRVQVFHREILLLVSGS